MLLIGHFDSPYVRRVAISLHVLGLAFRREMLSVFGDAEKMRGYNPLGRVPALVLDGGETLIDSAAILDHLDEAAGPTKALLPISGVPRREALQVMALATGCNDKAMAIAYERRRPAHLVDESWIVRCLAQLDAGLGALEDRLPSQVPDRLMQREITVAAMLGYVRLREPEALSATRHSRLRRLSAVCEATAAFKACLPTVEEIGGADADRALERLRGP